MTGEPRRIGLALGSGSARGWAHLGVIEALQELELPLHCIAGTSIGALVGAVHAAGATDSLREAVLGLDWKELLRIAAPVLPRQPRRVHMRLHTVEAGEDLNTVAMMYDVSITELQEANALEGTSLSPGQVLKIPMAE